MTTTRDRERLDAVAMKTQRMDNSVAPVTGASEGGRKVVARQLTAADRKHLERGGFANPGDRGPERGCARPTRSRPRLHVPTPVREYFLIGPEHTDSTQQ